MNKIFLILSIWTLSSCDFSQNDEQNITFVEYGDTTYMKLVKISDDEKYFNLKNNLESGIYIVKSEKGILQKGIYKKNRRDSVWLRWKSYAYIKDSYSYEDLKHLDTIPVLSKIIYKDGFYIKELIYHNNKPYNLFWETIFHDSAFFITDFKKRTIFYESGEIRSVEDRDTLGYILKKIYSKTGELLSETKMYYPNNKDYQIIK